MIAGGVYLGAAMDTFRRFEPLWKKRKIFAFSLEILFWLLQALILFYVLYLINQGELRFYILLALICGFAMYKSLFNQLYLRILEWVINAIVSIYHFLYRLLELFIIQPIKFLFKLIISVLLSIWGIILWLLIIAVKIVWYPISFVFKIIWRLLPQNAKKYIIHLGGFYSKIKNRVVKWWNKFRNRKG
ncbi:spore cortex biosynthesis protein YabQ [Aquibacillus sp. 3ASR75-54]|uniref:Spore cortex biosynthesis protein YabQ n=2 Tax=Aquibacillus salsiterrae TaxID=2950439 RepID=A0A9X4AFE4_9BACI|nr:spore cortex biosynthesis protein YabQ [Aquibacillus salsiterrae]